MMKHTQGFIALTSVLILSAIFLSMSISVASRAISGSGVSIAFSERDTARYLTHACSEHARMELERTLDYRGNESILIEGKECRILEIQGTGNTNRILRVESTVGAHTYHIEEYIETISPQMVITTSERVTNF